MWAWFLEFSAGRGGNGFGPNPISYLDLLAWSTLTGTITRPSEIEAIMALDRVWMTQQAANVRTGADGRYALTSSHTGAHFAACFRTNTEHMFQNLPADTAWALGSTGQRLMLLRRHRVAVAASNELDHLLDITALDRLVAAAIAVDWRG